MHYDLVDLRVFLAVLDEGNLSRGAVRCNLAPSSVSARIRTLEEAVGTRLLQRNARGVSSTPAGVVLAEHARRLLAQLEQMHADLSPFAQGVTGRVILFANTNAINSFLPDDLAHFFNEHPSVRVSLEERNSGTIVAALVEGRADVGVMAVEEKHPLLEYLPYRVDELVLAVPRGHALSRKRAVRFSECLEFPFISLLQGAALHTFLVRHAGDIGGRLDLRVQLAGYEAVCKLVGSGAGIGLVPRSAVSGDAGERVKLITLAEPWAHRELNVGLRKVREPNFYRDELVACLSRQRKS